jgi:hypothetical protein
MLAAKYATQSVSLSAWPLVQEAFYIIWAKYVQLLHLKSRDSRIPKLDNLYKISYFGDRWTNPSILAGPDMAYLYPDLSTALVGRYQDGQLVVAQAARLTAVTWQDNILVPHFTITSTR